MSLMFAFQLFVTGTVESILERTVLFQDISCGGVFYCVIKTWQLSCLKHFPECWEGNVWCLLCFARNWSITWGHTLTVLCMQHHCHLLSWSKSSHPWSVLWVKMVQLLVSLSNSKHVEEGRQTASLSLWQIIHSVDTFIIMLVHVDL